MSVLVIGGSAHFTQVVLRQLIAPTILLVHHEKASSMPVVLPERCATVIVVADEITDQERDAVWGLLSSARHLYHVEVFQSEDPRPALRLVNLLLPATDQHEVTRWQVVELLRWFLLNQARSGFGPPPNDFVVQVLKRCFGSNFFFHPSYVKTAMQIIREAPYISYGDLCRARTYVWGMPEADDAYLEKQMGSVLPKKLGEILREEMRDVFATHPHHRLQNETEQVMKTREDFLRRLISRYKTQEGRLPTYAEISNESKRVLASAGTSACMHKILDEFRDGAWPAPTVLLVGKDGSSLFPVLQLCAKEGVSVRCFLESSQESITVPNGCVAIVVLSESQALRDTVWEVALDNPGIFYAEMEFEARIPAILRLAGVFPPQKTYFWASVIEVIDLIRWFLLHQKRKSIPSTDELIAEAVDRSFGPMTIFRGYIAAAERILHENPRLPTLDPQFNRILNTNPPTQRNLHYVTEPPHTNARPRHPERARHLCTPPPRHPRSLGRVAHGRSL